MKEFLLIFRADASTNRPQPSPDQMQASMKNWQNWLGSIAAQNKLVTSGNRLANDGRVVKPGNLVTDGPYVETKEAIGGYSIIKVDSLEEAAEIAKGCPILAINGNVEIREIEKM
jgi:hypothetical protein